MKKIFKTKTIILVWLPALLMANTVSAQTDIDAIMMEKNAFCVGPMYSYSSWKKYWKEP
ncbi:MAG: hypothetical protein WDO71_22360 [Bacteroidota bacterium]